MINKIKKTKTVKEFIVGQLALQDNWDDGRGNSTTTTKLVLIRYTDNLDKDYVAVMEENGSLAVVRVNTLRHLPEIFNGATF